MRRSAVISDKIIKAGEPALTGCIRIREAHPGPRASERPKLQTLSPGSGVTFQRGTSPASAGLSF